MTKRLLNFVRIPASYLSMIASHSDIQNKGLGAFLLGDVLRLCMRIADQAGGRIVVLDATSDHAARLYGRFGFVPLASQPERMVVGMSTVPASERERQKRQDKAA